LYALNRKCLHVFWVYIISLWADLWKIIGWTYTFLCCHDFPSFIFVLYRKANSVLLWVAWSHVLQLLWIILAFISPTHLFVFGLVLSGLLQWVFAVWMSLPTNFSKSLKNQNNATCRCLHFLHLKHVLTCFSPIGQNTMAIYFSECSECKISLGPYSAFFLPIDLLAVCYYMLMMLR